MLFRVSYYHNVIAQFTGVYRKVKGAALGSESLVFTEVRIMLL